MPLDCFVSCLMKRNSLVSLALLRFLCMLLNCKLVQRCFLQLGGRNDSNVQAQSVLPGQYYITVREINKNIRTLIDCPSVTKNRIDEI